LLVLVNKFFLGKGLVRVLFLFLNNLIYSINLKLKIWDLLYFILL